MGHVLSRLPFAPSRPPEHSHHGQKTAKKDQRQDHLPMLPSRRPANTHRIRRTARKEQNQGDKSLCSAQTRSIAVINETQWNIQQGLPCGLNTSIAAEHNRKSDRREAPTTFHPYPRLPTELKYMIWESTLPTEARTIQLQKYKRPALATEGFHVRASPPTPATVHIALSVDRVSRASVFRNYIPLKIGMRILPSERYTTARGAYCGRGGRKGHKWLFPTATVYVSERLGDTIVARTRDVLLFPYRPARHGLDITTPTYLGPPSRRERPLWSEQPRIDVYAHGATPDMLREFFDKWWACLPRQEHCDSSPVGWEAEIDFWNSTKELDVPYMLEFRGRRPGACRRLDSGRC